MVENYIMNSIDTENISYSEFVSCFLCSKEKSDAKETKYLVAGLQ